MAFLTGRKFTRRGPSPQPVPARRRHFEGWLPAETVLAMPIQALDRGRLTPVAEAGPAPARRRLLLALTAAFTASAAAVVAAMMSSKGLSGLEAAALSLFVILFGWIAFAFVSAAAGFATLWRAGEDIAAGPPPVVSTRTALLAPTYNEDPGRILAAIQAMYEDLDAHGVAGLYDFYVLSDTRDETTARIEAAGVLRLRARLGAQARIFYRRREKNIDRKAGNIADWVQRFGGAYELMLILDADSLMSADTIIRLTGAMEADPKLGLLQTSPTIVNAETPFARLQQFASRAYGPMIAAGQDWWSGAEGNYWGHNAIIRTRAFAEHAGLPHLPGRKPFGGHILSHDFVEAALMRRGGWKIGLAASLGGSFEETPPTILDMAIRDRRWCQGNMQHAGVIKAAGLHWVSRLHMLRGIFSYVSSPLWLFLLLTGAGVWAEQSGSDFMVGGRPAMWLFAIAMALLIAPKFMAAALVFRDGAMRRGFGGGLRFVVSMVLEIVLSALTAPVLMLMQSMSVFAVLLGRDSGWAPQQRDPGRMSRKEAWKTHGAHMGVGAIAAALAGMLDPALFWWACPVYAGLVLSAPLSMLLSQPEVGTAFRRIGLFLTPEERRPPEVAVRAAELRAGFDAEAAIRWEVELLMRGPSALYDLKELQQQRFEAAMRLAAE